MHCLFKDISGDKDRKNKKQGDLDDARVISDIVTDFFLEEIKSNNSRFVKLSFGRIFSG